MSLAASVVNGELVQQTASANSANGKSQQSSGSTMDKESFLQLLVAQMKYQDPMEPTSNTEYVAQYAQFSELEAMQNLSSARLDDPQEHTQPAAGAGAAGSGSAPPLKGTPQDGQNSISGSSHI